MPWNTTTLCSPWTGGIGDSKRWTEDVLLKMSVVDDVVVFGMKNLSNVKKIWGVDSQ